MRMMTHMTFSEINTRRRMSVVANPSACTGCRTCEFVCSLIKTGSVVPEMARVHIDREPFEGKFLQKVCHQCSIPHCLYACPEKAMGISEKNGAVLIDRKKCTGCGLCADACPYGMIILDEAKKLALKCDLCGGTPQCVKACPVNALGISFFGNREVRNG